MSVRDGPFHPLRIDPKPCDAETLRQHLESFIQSFVRPDRRERAAHIVFRLAPKQAHRLGELHQMLDERHTSAPKEIQLPEGLPEAGVYYDGGPEGWLMLLIDAETVHSYFGRDVIWSGVPGIYAKFLHHEMQRWVCYRQANG